MSADRLADLKRYEQIRLESSLGCYKPYAKQLRFHELGREKRERMLMAGNRCISPWTWIQTPAESVQSAELFSSEDANVLSWAGESECAARLQRGFLRGIEQVFRIVLDNGLFFDCSATHRILSESGWISLSRLVSLSSGLHSWHKVEDYLANCVAYGYLCDPRLRSAEDTGLVQLPLPGDALNNSLPFSRADAEARISLCTNALQPGDLLSSPDGQDQIADLCAHFAGPFSPQPVLPLNDCIAVALRSVRESFQQLSISQVLAGESLESFPTLAASCEYRVSVNNCQRLLLEGQYTVLFERAIRQRCSLRRLDRDTEHIGIFYPFEHPTLVGGSRILAVVPLGFQPLLDVQIPGPNNYKAGGVYHHNCGKTFSAAAEVAFHLLGQYPDWWPGRRFLKPGRWGIGSKTAELTRDGAQKMLLGPFGRFGTGAIPKAALIDYKLSRGIPESVDIFRVKHASGGIAEGVLKAYADGREKWQADEWQGAWLDEESPEDIYSEASARTAVTSGPMLTTLTPLLGMSNVVRRFYPDQGHPDRGLVMMSLDEAEHFDAESRRKAIEAYLPHERDARVKGLPMLGEGAVYPISEEMIAEDIFDIPAWWPQLIAMDFGWHDHPTAAVKAAWDRDNDCVHITACYKQSKQPLVVYAAGIKAMGGDKILVAWPHDGLMHDKSSGSQIAQLYKQQGLRMLSEHAQFPDDRKNGTEAAVWEALARMQTNRLKVARHLSPWFEECRSYHRKDGKVVPEHDDLMKATHYGLMMLRYAEAGERAPQKDDRYGRRRSRHHSWMAA